MNNTMYLIIIVAAVLAGSVFFYLVAKKLGLSLINVALSIVTAVKTALMESTLSGGKVSIILDLVVQALSYVQAICDDAATTDAKVDKAFIYVQSIASQLGIGISDTEAIIIKNVLQIGFTVMGALSVSSKASYKRLYSRMSRYSGADKPATKAGLARISHKIIVYQRAEQRRGRN